MLLVLLLAPFLLNARAPVVLEVNRFSSREVVVECTHGYPYVYPAQGALHHEAIEIKCQ